MKLDTLTLYELECYHDWNSADEHGGDCQTIGYSWAVWQDERIIIVEDDQGFVDACTYDTQEAYLERLHELQQSDADWDAREQEDEERDSAITDVYDTLQDAREELKDYQDAHNGRCHSCEAMMIQGVYCHEAGCPAQGKITSLRTQLERMENDY
jgi:hypothetical protein